MGQSELKKQLMLLYESMSEEGRQVLVDYAVFLQDRYPTDKNTSTEPVAISRPDEETVIAAIRRLSATYPMLDNQALLHDTAAYMMRHVVKGEAANLVIDELEVYFRQQYEAAYRES